jgi:methyl-accepting chemotaxis protein
MSISPGRLLRVPRPSTLRGKLIVQVLPVAAAALAAVTLIAVLNGTNTARSSAAREMSSLAQAQANKFDSESAGLQNVGQTMATMMSGYRSGNRMEADEMLQDIARQYPSILGSYVVYEPNAFDGNDAAHKHTIGADPNGRFVPYWNRLSGSWRFDPLDNPDNQIWYAEPKQNMRATVIEPYLYNGVLMSSFISPIVRDGVFVGISGIDRSLASFDKQVSAIKVLKTGYAFLVSHSGIFVSFPKKGYIGTLTIQQLAKRTHDSGLAAVARGMLAGRSGWASIADPLTHRAEDVYYAPISTGGWSLAVVAPQSEVYAGANSLRTTLLITAFALLLALAGVLAVVATRFTRPIVEVGKAAERIGSGDLDVEIAARSNDEIGRTAAAFGEMVANLRTTASVAEAVAGGDLTATVTPRSDKDVLGKALATMVESLRSMVGELTGAAASLSSASTQMAHSSEEAGRAVGEIAQSVSDVASGAQRQVTAVEAATQKAAAVAAAAARGVEEASKTAEATDGSRDAAREGADAVSRVTNAIESVRDSAGVAVEAIRSLDEKSEQIGSIVATITAIASQTNLLALNAAIEAARAGEHGRGFAVVAEEVRKLAEESDQAAKSIAGLIDQIQAETSHVVSVVEDSTRRTAEGAQTVGEAKVAFERIDGSVQAMAGGVGEIIAVIRGIADLAAGMESDMRDVAAVAEQSSASSEEVSAATEETSASTQQIAASAAQLAESAGRLEKLCERFSLS